MNRKVLTITGVILAVACPFFIKLTNKNTCTSYLDYFLINFGGNCYYNPDVDLSVSEIIEKYSGNSQNYTFTTQDGYILTMFRIFRKDPIGVVLLQPPISAGAVAWLSDGADSLGITLWEKGYDVWLSNHRGASYSRKHVNLTETDPEFWDYSFHEIAVYDLEAQFELIYKETNNGSKINFVGYSMSSTVGLTYAALKPKNSKKFVKSYILVAPVVIMKHFTSLFKYLFYIMKPFEKILIMGEFLTFEVVRWVASFINATPSLINFGTSMVMGWTLGEMDPILYPYIFAHHGRGITNKMIYHYGQIFFNQSHFSMYDYGKETTVYPLRDIQTPVYIIYGDNDELAAPSDIRTLCEMLPKEQVYKTVEIQNHNHIDYMFSIYRKEKTYEIIYKILEDIDIF